MKSLKLLEFLGITGPRLIARGKKNLRIHHSDTGDYTSQCIVECWSDEYVRIDGYSNRLSGSGATWLYYPVTFTSDSNSPFVFASPLGSLQSNVFMVVDARKDCCAWDASSASVTNPFHILVEGYAVKDQKFYDLCKELSNGNQ